MHTAIALKSIGAIPITIDNLNDYYDITLKEMRIKNLEEHEIKFEKIDLCDESALKDLFEEYVFDYVLHLAAQAGVRYSIEKPLAYVRSNVQCFVTLMEVIVDSRQNPIISYASSSSVYGKNDRIPFQESQTIVQQRSVYGATKAADELLAHVYHDMYSLRMTRFAI
eukprot:UN32363